MREFSDAEWQKIEDAVERLGGIIRQVADGHDDDEWVNSQPVIDAIAEACGQPPPDLPNDGWIEAGLLRQRTRQLMEAIASGAIRD